MRKETFVVIVVVVVVHASYDTIIKKFVELTMGYLELHMVVDYNSLGKRKVAVMTVG